MEHTRETLNLGWIEEPRFSALTRLRLFGVRRAIACVAAALVCGVMAWNWATPVAAALGLDWVAPVAGLLTASWIALQLAQVDAHEGRS
jgi:hypothetical protein